MVVWHSKHASNILANEASVDDWSTKVASDMGKERKAMAPMIIPVSWKFRRSVMQEYFNTISLPRLMQECGVLTEQKNLSNVILGE
jgi:hypothetical protein